MIIDSKKRLGLIGLGPIMQHHHILTIGLGHRSSCCYSDVVVGK
jgi:hypothetical protein